MAKRSKIPVYQQEIFCDQGHIGIMSIVKVDSIEIKQWEERSGKVTHKINVFDKP